MFWKYLLSAAIPELKYSEFPPRAVTYGPGLALTCGDPSGDLGSQAVLHLQRLIVK